MARGTVRKRSKDTYEIRWDEPNKDGKRQQKSKTIKGTKRAAEAELNRIEADLAKSPAERAAERASEMPVSECVALYLEARGGIDLRPTTVVNYKGVFNNYLLPVCGEMPLASADRPVLQKVIRRMINAPLAPSTIKSRVGTVKSLFTWAVEQGHLPATPADHLTVPECTGESAGQMLSGPEVNDLLAALEGTPSWLPAFLAVHTGMRPGEALALSWNDVDLVRGTVSVSHTMHRNRDCSLKIGPAKNTASVRTMAIPPVVVEVLREVKQQMPEEFWFMAKDVVEGHLEYYYVPTEFRQVCAQPDGGILSHAAWGKEFRSILRRAGLRQIRLHDLRHTHASLLLLDGVPIHVVSTRLGHANIATTIKIYGHLLPSSDSDAALRFAEIVRKAA